MNRAFTGLAVFFLLSLPPVCWAAVEAGSAGSARPGQIRGQLHRPDHHLVPAGIAIVLLHQAGDAISQTQTDSAGKFEFRQLPAALYRIKVHIPGYLDIETGDLNLTLTSMVYLNLDLKPDPSYQSSHGNQAPGGIVSVESLNAPEGARKDLESGKQLLARGKEYRKGIELFKRAIEAYPKYSEAHLMMGLAYRAEHALEEAGAALRRCLEINPRSVPAHIALGELHNESRDYAAAEKTLLQALALDPDSPLAHEELARTYWAIGRWQDADPHATRAVALLPTSPSGHLIMGNIDLRKRDAPAALQEFHEYLKLQPEGAMSSSVREMIAKIEKALAESKDR